MPNILAFTKASEGANIASIQAATNKLYTCTGASESTTGTNYGAPSNTISNGDSHETALTKLADKFDPSTGHTHDGSAGNGGPVAAQHITNMPLLGYIQIGTQFSANGGSNVVTSLLTGKTPSSSSTVAGIPISPPYNRVRIQNALGFDVLDSNGNTVYGRIVYSSGVWSINYYSEYSGSDVAYSFPGSTTINWWYPELFNPLDTPPVYNNAIFLVPGNQGVLALHNMNYTESGPNVPVKQGEGRETVFMFPSGSSGTILYIGFKVPTDYKVGSPINLNATIYSPSSSNTILLSAVSYLVRANVDAIDSTTNSHTSTNTALTNAVANRIRTTSIDLSSSTGTINSIAVNPDDFIIVGLVRGTDTDSADLRFVPRLTEVVFQ